MMATLRAELRKIFTIRSTYIILGSILALIALFAGFIDGYRASATELAMPSLLTNEAINAVGTVSVLSALVGLLLFAHEYRYNTIMYTLTAARSRTRVLVAKIVAVTIFVVPVTILVGILSPLFAVLGMHLHGLHMVAQTINYGDILWRCLFFGWGYAMFALVFVALIRNQVGAIIIFFLAPGTIENIAGLLLKGNQKYLPFTALGTVLNTKAIPGTTPVNSAIIAACYMVVFWAAAWWAFARRDAN